MSNFFINYPEFINEDSRRHREHVPITAETLDRRHEVLLPSNLLKDATVLDLGSCIGATGHWCLSFGAKHYTGVEIQKEMCDISQRLLGNYWTNFDIVNSNIETFLDTQKKTYDVVILLGVIYAFMDTYSLLKKVSRICNHVIVVDGSYPHHMLHKDSPVIDVINNVHINSTELNLAYNGIGVRASPAAISKFLNVFGFGCTEGLLYPRPLEDPNTHDTYITAIKRPGSKVILPSRYMMRFFKNAISPIKTITDAVLSQDKESLMPMIVKPESYIKSTPWVFDEQVANRFQKEAETHIPDYHRVLNLCVDYVTEIYKNDKSIKLIDVGSALGYTVDKFLKLGYTNIFGVENSQHMYERSSNKNQIILSNVFPKQTWDVVLANWTLHFIHERKDYLQNIYNNLAPGGILILTDKMNHDDTTEQLYHKFKFNNGISQDDIAKKKQAIVGVLVTKPLNWYLDTLADIGFRDVQVVNSRFMFNTIYARKWQ